MAGFREAYAQAGAVILEPIMKVEVTAPEEFQGSVIGNLNQRRGMILNSDTNDGYVVAQALVPFSEMFGYSTTLRSATQGKGEFSMEFNKYEPVPKSVQEEMVRLYKEKRAAENK
jgi:elongation factor G